MLRASWAAVAVAAMTTLAVAPPDAGAVADFHTPRHAAYCGTSHGTGPVRLVCWRPSDGLTVSMRPRGLPRKRYVAANRGYHDPAVGHGVLRFGRSIRLARAYRCTSRRSGLSCRNRAGHGWRLGRFGGHRVF